MSTTKMVTIQIATDDMKTLKQNKYNLCFAKMVNNTFNVVWQSQNPTQYLTMNTLSWTPVYQIYGVNNFSAGLQVTESTNAVAIGLGEQATLDSDGVMLDAVTGGKPTDLTLDNEFAPICPGVNQLISGQAQPTPIYVAPNQAVKGIVALTPIESVQIWFEQNIATSTMFSTSRSNPMTVDLTFSDSATVSYQNGIWIKGPLPPMLLKASGAESSNLLTIVIGTTATITAALLASKIMTKLTGVYTSIAVDVNLKEGKYVVNYTEKPALTASSRSLLGTMQATGVLSDQLTVITANSLNELGASFNTFDATAA